MLILKNNSNNLTVTHPLSVHHPCFNQSLTSYNEDLNSTTDPELIQEKVIYAKVFFSLYCAATICLLITVISYAATWKKQTLNGWTILAFSLSTFGSYLFWTVGLGKWLFQTADRPCGNSYLRPVLMGTPFCSVVGGTTLFFDFAAFTWLTLLNFHICVTIRSMKPRSTASTNIKRFWIFSLVGFGVPTIITIVSLILEHHTGYFDDQVVRLEYGYDPCGVDKYYVTYMVKFVYGVVLILKFIFACLVIKALWNYKKGTKLVQHNLPNPKKEFAMYAKLLVLMDFTWICEIIWGLNYGEGNTYTWYRVLQDTIYILQAFCLFWVFVCKREMKNLLSQEYPFCKTAFTWIDERFQWVRCTLPNSNGANSQERPTVSGSYHESSSKGIAMSRVGSTEVPLHNYN